MRVTLPWIDKRLSPNARWTPEADELLSAMWADGVSRREIAEHFGCSVGAVANRAYRLRLSAPREWSEAHIQIVRDAYSTAQNAQELDVAGLAKSLGRTYNAVVVKAGRLQLTDLKRPVLPARKVTRKHKTLEDAYAAIGAATKRRIAERGHPRGYAGKRHTEAARRIIGEKAAAWNKSLTPEQRAERIGRQLKTKIERYGTIAQPRPSASWKAGWREIGGKRNYYRSRWEANYARYLEWLKQRGEIADWQHEPETFWFEGIKRGVRSYLPDFRVCENDGSTALHEVKGWMDARSKTTLKRMAKYHPGETVIVIREKQYNEIARKVGRMIEGWEHSGRAGRW